MNKQIENNKFMIEKLIESGEALEERVEKLECLNKTEGEST